VILPLPPLDTADITARAAIYQGYNDNVVEIRPDPTQPGDRRGALFTGGEVGVSHVTLGPRSERTLSLTLRGSKYEVPASRSVGGDDGAATLGARDVWSVAPNHTLSLSQTLLFGDQNATRLNDQPLANLDPSLGRRLFLYATTDAGWSHDIDARDRQRLQLGLELRDIFHDTAPAAAPPGVDYVMPRADYAFSRELGPVDRGELRTALRWYSTPNALLSFDGTRGPRQTWQAAPGLAWIHEMGDGWQTTLGSGVSFATRPSSEEGGLLISPTAQAEALYASERFYAMFGYSFGYSTVSPTLGPGITHGLGAQVSGPFSATGFGRRISIAWSLAAGRSSVPITADASYVITTGATDLIARWAMSPWIGLLAGYEGRWVRYSPGGTPAFETWRNIGFVGLGGTFSSNPAEPALEAPRPPPR
jgi:hypothetical protein